MSSEIYLTKAARNLFGNRETKWFLIRICSVSFVRSLVSIALRRSAPCAKCIWPYVYWNVHHLDSSVKRDQLDVTCFIISTFNTQHVSDVNTSILRNLRLICWVISWVVLLRFDMCWCYVVVWLWWCGFSLRTDTTPPQPNNNVTPTHIDPEQYNPWNNSTHKSQAPEDGCINIRNMLSIKWRNNKASDIKLVSLYSTSIWPLVRQACSSILRYNLFLHCVVQLSMSLEFYDSQTVKGRTVFSRWQRSSN